MSASIDELVHQIPAGDRIRVMTKLAQWILDQRPGEKLLTLQEDHGRLVGLLMRCPPIPEQGPYTEADRAEDARRLANRHDSVTAKELVALIDFGKDNPGRAGP